jgi:hypothetical protein
VDVPVVVVAHRAVGHRVDAQAVTRKTAVLTTHREITFRKLSRLLRNRRHNTRLRRQMQERLREARLLKRMQRPELLTNDADADAVVANLAVRAATARERRILRATIIHRLSPHPTIENGRL